MAKYWRSSAVISACLLFRFFSVGCWLLSPFWCPMPSKPYSAPVLIYHFIILHCFSHQSILRSCFLRRWCHILSTFSLATSRCSPSNFSCLRNLNFGFGFISHSMRFFWLLQLFFHFEAFFLRSRLFSNVCYLFWRRKSPREVRELKAWWI